MMWAVLLHDAFDAELNDLPEAVQDEVLAHMGLLKQFGPNARFCEQVTRVEKDRRKIDG